MLTLALRSIGLTLILAALLCGVYPLAVTAIGKTFFNEKVNGGMIALQNGIIVGSKIIGQSFSKPEYFHGRPSAAGNSYDAANSSGSNLGPTNQKLNDRIKASIETLLKENPTLKKGDIPVDMVTTSASGLDPHISHENALAQAERIAQSRNAGVDQIKSLILDHVEGPQLGLLGEKAINVLLLNLDLDRLIPMK